MGSVTEQQLEQVRAGMRGLTPASAYDKVYNDECVFSFDTPLSPGGLYVSLRSFLGFGAQHVQADSLRTGNSLYAHIHVTRVPKPKPEPGSEAASAPTKMAIGMEGGFNVDEPQYEEHKETALVLMPAGERIPLPCDDLPTLVSQCLSAVLSHAGANAEAKEAAVAWEAEVKPSKYANDLLQLPAHKTISPDPSSWVCEESGEPTPPAMGSP
jgi:ubiquitin carboxyl-terminal hydrolase 5/13